ncbi:CPXCG motif-containing cysteine-rich protein [Dyella silvae]|uniref:CPXCG motif-containing cysteine-rich protein n=1 Tax=Dyella silvae TaxID=2994424 RepID=UPI002263C02B|nr:CPXCG motif-containing cysteine-rich protein [Dyella silvae]
MLESVLIHCPYCGEPIEILVDASVDSQRYIEDCQVCCRPIDIAVDVDEDGELHVSAASENDG